MTGKQVWNWIKAHPTTQTVGSMSFPTMTVAELEAACGKGAIAKVNKHFGGGGSVLFARAIAPIDQVYTDPVKVAEWKENYGEMTTLTRRTAKETLPTDQVTIHHGQVG